MSFQVPTRTGRIAPVKPNWSRPVEQEFVFKTYITTSRDGTEQRMAMRQAPRSTFQFTSSLTKLGVDRLVNDIMEEDGAISLFVFHSPWRRVATTAEALAAQAVVSLAEIPFWMQEGTRVVLRHGNTLEAAIVLSVSGNDVTMEEPLENTFPADAKVHHANVTRVQNTFQFNALVQDVWQSNIRLDVDPGSDPVLAPTVALDTFEDQEVFRLKPNWRDVPRLDFAHDREVVDHGQGVIDVNAPQGFVRNVEQLTFTGLSYDKAEELLAFFLRMKGRRGQFWHPVRERTFRDYLDAAAASTSLVVSGTEYFDTYQNHRIYKALYAEWPDGSWQINRIVNYGLSGDDTVINLTDGWDSPVDADTDIRWCPTCRFSTDTVEMSWETTKVAETQFSFQTIPE